VRGDAAAALGEFEKAPVGLLINMLVKDSAPAARAGAARGLGRRAKIPDAWGGNAKPDAIKQLYRSLYDDSPEVRQWAITAVGKITALRFDYDANVSPARQRAKLAKIRSTLLHRCKIRF